jgi:hypothetical protein
VRLAIVAFAVAVAACQEGVADPGGAAEVAAAPAEAPPAARARPPQSAEKAFCLRTLSRTSMCLGDDAYWNTLATLYFAASGQPVDDQTKQGFIGDLKDDMVKLRTDRAFDQNCDRMIEGLKLPTPAQMEAVNATEGKSCAEYAAKLGYLIFHEGVFHQPR